MITTRVRHLSIRLSGVVLVFIVNISARAQVIEVPIELYKDEILIEAKINGKGPLVMILDTGTDPSAIDIATADSLGIKRSKGGDAATGGGTDKNLAFGCRLVGVEVGELKVGTIDAAAISLSKINERLGKRIDGVLGYSLLKNRIVQIDYLAGKLRFLNATPAIGRNAVTMKFRYKDNVLVSDITINGKPATANIDTGSNSSFYVSASGIERLGLAKAAADGIPKLSVGYNGQYEHREGKLDRITVGSISVSDAEATFAAAGSGTEKSPWDVNIGNKFLKDYRVTIDYRAKTVTLERP